MVAAYCWGYNVKGQLGNGTKTTAFAPVAVSGDTTWTSIATCPNASNTCAIDATGSPRCWGNNCEQALGDGTDTNSLVPVPAASGLKLKMIESGTSTTCALTMGDHVYCWAFPGTSGTMGVGRTFTSGGAYVPLAVEPPAP